MRSVSTPPTRPSRRDLVTTGKAADAVGVSHRSLLYWVGKGWIKPTWRSPSGRYMWSVEHLESQLSAMEELPPDEPEQ
jgi:predicted site-specific integrase-resolvase